MSAKKKIVITGIGTAGATNVAKAFAKRRKDVELVGLDCDPVNPGKFFVDRCLVVPRANDPKFLDAITQIIKKEKPDLFIPVMPFELPMLSREAKALSKYTKVLISPPETITTFFSKKQTLDFFTKAGVPNAGYYKDTKKIIYPVFCKPDDGTGSFHSERVNDKKELDEYLAKHKNTIIMPLLEGKEYSVDGFCDKDGTLVGFVARWRMQTKGMGVATKGVTEEIPGLRELLERITKNIRIIGPFNAQFFVLPDGKISFFEVNPRMGGTYIHSVEAGLDLAQYLIDFIDGKKSKPLKSYRTGLVMIRGWQEWYENA